MGQKSRIMTYLLWYENLISGVKRDGSRSQKSIFYSIVRDINSIKLNSRHTSRSHEINCKSSVKMLMSR